MGEIADMHVEAYASGLDPTEMDGADWAEFLDGGEKLSDAAHAAQMLNGWFAEDLADAEYGIAQEGETREETIRRLWPIVTDGQASSFVAVLDLIITTAEGKA